MANKVIPTNMPHPMSAVGWDGTDFHILTIDAAGHLQVDNLSSALPTGAATAANQLTEIAALQLIDDLRAALHSVNTDELQVNVEDSALPTGAATAANQATEITDLETMMLYDRGLAKVVNAVNASYAAHAETTRYTYTVGAGKRGLLEACHFTIGLPSAGKNAYAQVAVNGVVVTKLNILDSSTGAMAALLNWVGEIWLTAGDIVTMVTYSDSVANVGYYVTTIISEFNA